MAILNAPVPPVLGRSFQGGTNQGQASGFVAATGGGDMIPLSGQGVLVTIRTSGTASTVTFDSTTPSNYGDDKNVTVVLAATDEQEVFISTSIGIRDAVRCHFEDAERPRVIRLHRVREEVLAG